MFITSIFGVKYFSQTDFGVSYRTGDVYIKWKEGSSSSSSSSSSSCSSSSSSSSSA